MKLATSRKLHVLRDTWAAQEAKEKECSKYLYCVGCPYVGKICADIYNRHADASDAVPSAEWGGVEPEEHG